jgi:pyruvate/2-oxoglutarate dehydrogenase complex dihydrolipoamide acyltransferase (E2) component
MGKISLKKMKTSAVFRKVAMGTWKTTKDPSTYALCEIDMFPALEQIKAYSKKHGVKITPAHLIGKAMVNAFKEIPHANVIIRGSRIYKRDEVSLFYQVNIPKKGSGTCEKDNLSGCSIHNANDLKTADIAKLLLDKASKVRNNKDEEVARSMSLITHIPWALVGYFLDLTSFLIYGLNLNLNLNLNFLGLPRDPFGSVMITNIGSLGMETGFAPLVPFSRVPIVLAVGSIVDRAWVVDGEIKVRPILRVGATVDHRVIDGVHGASLIKIIQKNFAQPEIYLFND